MIQLSQTHSSQPPYSSHLAQTGVPRTYNPNNPPIFIGESFGFVLSLN